MKAYHFLRADMRAGRGTEPAWEVGETRELGERVEIKLCEKGYHASPTLWDALLRYAPGPVACIVEVEPVASEPDKVVSRSRTLIKAVNIERELRLYAADCAEHVLHIFERAYPNDKRPREAIQAARDFANGKIDAAARAAAWAAAGDAAGAAALAAAGAAARAASAAAWAAALAAAGAAAGDAEIKWQQEHFDGMFGGIFQ